MQKYINTHTHIHIKCYEYIFIYTRMQIHIVFCVYMHINEYYLLLKLTIDQLK